MANNFLTTEDLNPRTENLDRISIVEAVELCIDIDFEVFQAVKNEAAAISKAVELISNAFRQKGRLVYVGAGTSGRLGFLDASECPPTFGVSSEMVVALMAGGKRAIQEAVEGAEDDKAAAVKDIDELNLRPVDVVVGITASGTTPYVRSALSHAKTCGCSTILLACNKVSDLTGISLPINLLVGPEVISGSTRLKSGTACKLVLNMLSTLSMVQIGKVYKNFMVDVVASNEKLNKRAIRIVMQAGGAEESQAEELLRQTGGAAKPAIYMARKKVSLQAAQKALQEAEESLARALEEI